MAMGRQGMRQGDLILAWDELPCSPGHPFYDKLQEILDEAKFDEHAEKICEPYYAGKMGAKSIPPGRYFRMHLIGYFEGIDSERGLEWRCSDSLSLREFLRLGPNQRVPDHSSLSRIRTRLPLEVHENLFEFVLKLLAQNKLIVGKRLGFDASTMAANAALRNIESRLDCKTYREMLVELAKESGIDTPTSEDLIKLDKNRKNKKMSNKEWKSRSDGDARIAKMKNGSTHMAYKPEHAVDLDTGAIIAAEIQPADEGDTTTLPKTLQASENNLAKIDAAPTEEAPAECVADKGYYGRDGLKQMEDGPWKTRIAEPDRKDFNRWHGDDKARRAVYNNRARLKSGVAKEAMKLRAEKVERSFQHTLDRGGMRRVHLRGNENIRKRYLIHVAGFNLSLIMRQSLGYGTPKGFAERLNALFVLFVAIEDSFFAFLIVKQGNQSVFTIAPTHHRPETYSTGR